MPAFKFYDSDFSHNGGSNLLLYNETNEKQRLQHENKQQRNSFINKTSLKHDFCKNFITIFPNSSVPSKQSNVR